MGTQIQIAQTLADEAEMNQVLLRKFGLLCLPRAFSSRDPEPKRLGQYEAGVQVIFSEDFWGTVKENIRPVLGQPDLYLVFPNNGLCIEWNRTSCEDQGFAAGRYYCKLSDPVSKSSSDLMKRVMSLIVRTVRTTYPKKSAEKIPIFVGPDLTNKIQNGLAKFVFRDGTVIPVVDNL